MQDNEFYISVIAIIFIYGIVDNIASKYFRYKENIKNNRKQK